MSEPEDYAAQRLREALATDGRVAEMGVQVRVVAGKVFLTGQVATDERHQAIGTIAGEVLPEYELHNDTVVISVIDTPRVEHIS